MTINHRNPSSTTHRDNFLSTSSKHLSELKAAKNWLGLALGSLLLGGILSLLVLMERVPFVNRLIEDPLFAKKGLTIHVNLTLGCWNFAFLVALFLMIPGGYRGKTNLIVAILGIAAMVASGFIPGAEPILSNYFPILDNPVFFTGMFVFFIAVALTLFDKRLLPTGRKFPTSVRGRPFLSEASQIGLRTGVITFFLGIVIFIVSVWQTSAEQGPVYYYHTIFWGTGHLFQLVSISVMISVWLVLLAKILDGPILDKKAGYLLFGLQFAPTIISIFFITGGTSTTIFYNGFGAIMRWGTWPVPSIIIIISIVALFRARQRGKLTSEKIRSSSFQGFLWSVILILLGFALGSMIDRSTTLIPAHYHATIGAVTVSFMAITYLILEHLGMAIPTPRLKKLSIWQPAIFGVGQFTFVAGFAYAGMHGLGRKYFGETPAFTGLDKYISLGIVGVGGFFAIVGGGIFLYIAGRCWFQKPKF